MIGVLGIAYIISLVREIAKQMFRFRCGISFLIKIKNVVNYVLFINFSNFFLIIALSFIHNLGIHSEYFFLC